MSGENDGSGGGGDGWESGPTTQDVARTATPHGSARTLHVDDLVYINRMTTVGHVLPSVAHELNNALQVIGGLVELIGMRAEVGPDVRDKVQKIGVQANRSAGMIREFVAFARRDETMTRIDVHRAIEQALGLRRFYLSRARIDITMPAATPEPVAAQADSHAVLQVLLNLIINAEEALATKPQGERQLGFVVFAEGDTVVCQVWDSGPGFGERMRAPAPFFSTKSKGAAGLGLTVASALVDLDRGTLRFGDGPGGRVEVRWPRAR